MKRTGGVKNVVSKEDSKKPTQKPKAWIIPLDGTAPKEAKVWGKVYLELTVNSPILTEVTKVIPVLVAGEDEWSVAMLLKERIDVVTTEFSKWVKERNEGK